MKWSNFLAPTLRQMKGNITKSHELLCRAGFVAQEAAGIYYWLPLGYQSLCNIRRIVEEEMNNIGCLEIIMPTLQPASFWIQSGRYDAYGDEAFKLNSKRSDQEEIVENTFFLSPTNEEAVVELAKKFIKSYRQLEKPLKLRQMTAKFRNELRSMGLTRMKEFYMDDTYSFSLDFQSSNEVYTEIFNAYIKIFKRLGMNCVYAKADPGVIGGSLTHEFIILTPQGKSKVLMPKNISLEEHFNEKSNTEHINKDAGVLSEVFEDNPEEFNELKGIEAGHTFYFGSKYSEPMNFTVTDKSGQQIPVEMGSYGIGISRLLGIIAEVCNDDNGLVLPEVIAPYKYIIIDLFGHPEGQRIYDALKEKYTVLWDDRDLSPGIKLNDGDLIGMPYQIILGNHIELVNRKTKVSHQFHNTQDLLDTLLK